MSREDARELNDCLVWFVRKSFGKAADSNISVSVRGTDLDKFFDVRVRADRQEILFAVDTAAKFYAGEIDERIHLNFC